MHCVITTYCMHDSKPELVDYCMGQFDVEVNSISEYTETVLTTIAIYSSTSTVSRFFIIHTCRVARESEQALFQAKKIFSETFSLPCLGLLSIPVQIPPSVERQRLVSCPEQAEILLAWAPCVRYRSRRRLEHEGLLPFHQMHCHPCAHSAN